MPTRYGVSPWIEGVPRPRRPEYPRLRGETTAGVVIVGAGMTGCATALALSMAGLRPVVIESARIGQAGAGRHSGLLLPEPGAAFRDIQERYGLRAARHTFESWRRASLDGASILRRMRVRCGLEAADAIVASTRDERLLRREHDARSAAGLEGSWLAPRQVARSLRLEQGAAIRLPGAFTIDPYRACLGLAAAAARRGARFHEQSRVTAIRPSARHVDVIVGGGLVRAATVLVTTGTATAEFKPLQRHFRAREIFHALTEPVAPAVRRVVMGSDAVLRDIRNGRLQLRWTPDHQLVASGADLDRTPPGRRNDVLVQRTGELMYETLTRFPAISGLRPTHGWEMTYGTTADALPYIGPHRNYPRHLFALGGDGGSVTGAFLAARLLTRAVQGSPNKGDEVFGWTR